MKKLLGIVVLGNIIQTNSYSIMLKLWGKYLKLYLSFLTKDNDIIRIEPVLKTIDRFHKKYITVSTPDLLHGYVETIIINCSIKK
jgi:hypothetical protein